MAAAIIWLVDTIIGLMILCIIISAIASWLVAFDVINTRNRAVYSILSFLDSVTRPLMEPFRRIIPPLGGIDITPIIVLLGLQFVRMVFHNTAAPALYQLLGGAAAGCGCGSRRAVEPTGSTPSRPMRPATALCACACAPPRLTARPMPP